MNLLRLMVMQFQQMNHKPTSENGRKKKAYPPSPTHTQAPILKQCYSCQAKINFLSSLFCLINSNVVSSRWSYCHSREYVFYWWKEEKVISSNVGEGAYIGCSRMENTNRILNTPTSRNAKLVKYEDVRQITQKKESQTVQVFTSSPALLATQLPITWHNRGLECSG